MMVPGTCITKVVSETAMQILCKGRNEKQMKGIVRGLISDVIPKFGWSSNTQIVTRTSLWARRGSELLHQIKQVLCYRSSREFENPDRAMILKSLYSQARHEIIHYVRTYFRNITQNYVIES
jgi:hypothetical protein